MALQRERIEDFAERLLKETDPAAKDAMVENYFAKESVTGRRGVLSVKQSVQLVAHKLSKQTAKMEEEPSEGITNLD